MGFLPQESVVNEPRLVEVPLGVEWAYQDYYAICLKKIIRRQWSIKR